MKTAVVYQTNEGVTIEDRPAPEPNKDEILLKVESCGICGSELHAFTGQNRVFEHGLVMGHEFSGTVIQTGTAVEHIVEGERVAVYPAVGCGNCKPCSRGNAILCSEARPIMGGFAEYACIPAFAAVPLPKKLSFTDGALIEPFSVAYYGVKAAGIKRNSRVIVLGAGSIALATVFWAKHFGADTIIAMSRSTSREKLSLVMGADAFVPYGEDEKARAINLLGGDADIVFECVGYPGFLQKAIELVGTYGQIVSLGFGNQPETIIPATAGMKDVKMKFPVGYALDDFKQVANTMLNAHVDPKQLVSDQITLNQLPEKIETMRVSNRETKVHIIF